MERCRLQKWHIKLIVLLGVLLKSTAMAQERPDLVPDAVILQHAGSIGYFSIGGSYEAFKNKRGNVDVLYGFVPESKGGPLHIITAKFAYRPFVLNLGETITIHPVNPGMFFSYTFDKKLSFMFDKDQYGKGYYGWSEALRAHLSLSQEIHLNKRPFEGRTLKGVILYSEFNVSDLYLASWIQNPQALSPDDVSKLGVGVKVKF